MAGSNLSWRERIEDLFIDPGHQFPKGSSVLYVQRNDTCWPAFSFSYAMPDVLACYDFDEESWKAFAKEVKGEVNRLTNDMYPLIFIPIFITLGLIVYWWLIPIGFVLSAIGRAYTWWINEHADSHIDDSCEDITLLLKKQELPIMIEYRTRWTQGYRPPHMYSMRAVVLLLRRDASPSNSPSAAANGNGGAKCDEIQRMNSENTQVSSDCNSDTIFGKAASLFSFGKNSSMCSRDSKNSKDSTSTPGSGTDRKRSSARKFKRKHKGSKDRNDPAKVVGNNNVGTIVEVDNTYGLDTIMQSVDANDSDGVMPLRAFDRCPGNHPLYPNDIDINKGFVCTVCCRDIGAAGEIMSCRMCGWDICPECNKRTGVDPETLMEKTPVNRNTSRNSALGMAPLQSPRTPVPNEGPDGQAGPVVKESEKLVLSEL